MEENTRITGINDEIKVLEDVLFEIKKALDERDNLLFVLGGGLAIRVINDKIDRLRRR